MIAKAINKLGSALCIAVLFLPVGLTCLVLALVERLQLDAFYSIAIEGSALLLGCMAQVQWFQLQWVKQFCDLFGNQSL